MVELIYTDKWLRLSGGHVIGRRHIDISFVLFYISFV